MTITCPRSEAHISFRRVVTVQGPTFAILDQHGDVLRYDDCCTFRQVHSTSDVSCALCGEKPVIRVV
jgi:hypothetical protein